MNTLAILALLLCSAATHEYTIDASRISVLRVMAEKADEALGKTLDEKVTSYGIGKEAELYFYITSLKTREIKASIRPQKIKCRETIFVSKSKTVILTQQIEPNIKIRYLRSLIVIENIGAKTKVYMKTELYIKGQLKVFVDAAVGAKQEKIEEILRTHLE